MTSVWFQWQAVVYGRKAALCWLSENQNKLNPNRCHYPLITYLTTVISWARPNAGWPPAFISKIKIQMRKQNIQGHNFLDIPIQFHQVWIISIRFICLYKVQICVLKKIWWTLNINGSLIGFSSTFF